MNALQLTSYCWLILLAYWIWAGMTTKVTLKKEKRSGRYLYLVFMIVAFALVYDKNFQVGVLAKRFVTRNIYIEYGGLALTVAATCLALVARMWLGKNWSGNVTIKRDHELIQNGPYAITRHPIYTGIFFAFAGAVLVQGEIRGLIALLVLFCALQIKISKEEKFMNQIFPDYLVYANKTSKLIPFLY
jgi:protein-S-isoprenylcysteine O-methyltransferase Ste14